jgi:hypothetical protein
LIVFPAWIRIAARPGTFVSSQAFEPEGVQLPAVLLADESDGLVAVVGRIVTGRKGYEAVARVLVLLDLRRVFLQLRPPVLADAVAKDGILPDGPVDVNRVPPLVLEPTEGLDGGVAFQNHQVMAQSLELCVVGQFFQAVGDRIGRHACRASGEDPLLWIDAPTRQAAVCGAAALPVTERHRRPNQIGDG